MTVLGCGTVGLVAAACFADAGHEVLAVEVDPDRLAGLRRRDPQPEPGLDGLLFAAIAAGRLRFDARPEAGAEVAVLAVPTPGTADGSADLSALQEAVRALALAGGPPRLLLVKSTVPPGTHRAVAGWLEALGVAEIEVVSNPEFLRVGHAVQDFRSPARLLVGVGGASGEHLVRRLYAPLPDAARVMVVTGRTEAELAKLAANVMLAQRVAFANEIARLGQALDADPAQVLAAVGADPRLGSAHLGPSIGFGGSCLPKDTAALAAVGRSVGVELPLVDAATRSNAAQLDWVLEQVGAGPGRRVAIWGLAFKPGTDDLRDSAAVALVRALVDVGARVVVHDPAAALPGDLRSAVRQADTPELAAAEAEVVVVATAWPVYATARVPAGVPVVDPSGSRGAS